MGSRTTSLDLCGPAPETSRCRSWGCRDMTSQAERLKQIEQLLASAARYAESAKQGIAELRANQGTHEVALQALLADRQERHQSQQHVRWQTDELQRMEQQQQTEQMGQMVAHGHQGLDRQEQWMQELHQQLAISQSLMTTQQQQVESLSLMLGNLKDLMATQQQELALRRQQLDEQRRSNVAALERLDAMYERLMDGPR